MLSGFTDLRARWCILLIPRLGYRGRWISEFELSGTAGYSGLRRKEKRLSEGLVERREGTWNTAERWCSETAAAVLPRKDPDDVSAG